LSEDWRDFEKLTGKRRNQNPVEQTEIKLDVIFQIMPASDAQNGKAGAPTKAESLAEYHELQQSLLTDDRDHRSRLQQMREEKQIAARLQPASVMPAVVPALAPT
jgi:hypothetical protein